MLLSPKSPTSNGPTWPVWNSPRTVSKKPSFCQPNSQISSSASDSHGGASSYTVLQEPEKLSSPRPVPLRQTLLSSPFQVRIWSANMSAKVKKWSRPCSKWPERNSLPLFLWMKSTRWQGPDRREKMSRVEEWRPSLWCRCRELATPTPLECSFWGPQTCPGRWTLLSEGDFLLIIRHTYV